MESPTNLNDAKARRERLASFAALCAWIIGSATMAAIAYFWYGQDFRGYYAAARVLLNGGNPYDYSQVVAVLREVTGRAGNNPFYYPLWFGWFITPLAWMPFQAARAVWIIFNWGVWSLGLVRLQQLLGWPPKGWHNWLMNLLATFVFAWMTWKFEQTGILLFAIMVEILIAHRKRQWTRMGVYLALSLIKPNIMLLPATILAAWLIRRKNWRPVLVMLAILIGLILVTGIVTPDWYQPIIRPNFGQGLTNVLDGPNEVTGTRLNTTVLDWMKMLLVSRNLRIGIYVVIVLIGIVGLALAVWMSQSIMQIAIISLLTTFIITPYALQYDFPPLAIVLFWSTALASHAASKKVPLLIISLIASVLMWERPISDGFWIVIGLCGLVIWSWHMNRNKEIPQNLL
jgi:hypothetical protein